MKITGKISLIFMLLASIFSCSETETNTSVGRLSVELTDAPFPSDMVSEANVTISKIEIRKSDNDAGYPFKVLSEEEMSFNLLDLTNGVTATLVDMEIEAGSYDLIRLFVSEANVVLSDNSSFDLSVPSGAKTGIKIFIDPSIEVVGGLTAELLLDFDISKSFVVQGNPDSPAGIKGFLFTPTIKASNLSASGRLMGTVTDSLDTVIDGALISVFAADTLHTSTLTNENGEYTALGLTAGSYDITVEYGEYESVSIKDIEITAGNTTIQDVQLSDLNIVNILEQCLVAYYPFNGDAKDMSVYGNDGLINGATLTTDRDEKSESAYYFDGTSDIQIPTASFFNNMKTFCISAWVYPTELKYRDNTIISKVNPNRDFNLKILKTNMKYEAHFATSSPLAYYRCYSNQDIELNTWTHVLYQWTGEKWQLFINGEFENEVSHLGISPPWTGTKMAIGSMHNTEFFTGKIDEVRICNRVFTDTEIYKIYNLK